MTTAVVELPQTQPQAAQLIPRSRFDSVDALRGFVMFTMLYVNDVAGVPGAPWWMKHYHPETANGMTFVDWVFGGFLFIVGLSIPLAFASRIKRGEPAWKLMFHVLLRTASLLLLGFFMVNGERHPQPTGWPKGLWNLLIYTFGILAFLSVPKSSTRARSVMWLMRGIAFAGLIFLAIVFRAPDGDGMRPAWWGILGLIGWAYLVASVFYLVFRNNRAFLIGVTALLIGLFMFDRTTALDDLWLRRYINFGEMLGSHAAIATAGVVLGTMLLDASMSQTNRLRNALIWGVMLVVGALMLYPLYGINKNDATPSWCLICAAITCWLWVIFSAAIDVAGMSRPLGFFIRGGRNVLLAYMLMPVLIYCMQLSHFSFYWKIGQMSVALGITRSLVMAGLVLWLASLLNERGVRVKL